MNTCTASFASAPALDMKSLAELMNNFRRRGSASYTKKTRATGEIDTGSGDGIPTGGAAITNAALAGAGQMRAEVFVGDSDDAKKITVNPDDITTKDKTAQMREVTYTVQEGGYYDNSKLNLKTYKASFLATGPELVGEWEKEFDDDDDDGDGGSGSGTSTGSREECYPWDDGRGFDWDDGRNYPKNYPCW